MIYPKKLVEVIIVSSETRKKIAETILQAREAFGNFLEWSGEDRNDVNALVRILGEHAPQKTTEKYSGRHVMKKAFGQFIGAVFAETGFNAHFGIFSRREEVLQQTITNAIQDITNSTEGRLGGFKRKIEALKEASKVAGELSDLSKEFSKQSGITGP